MGDVYEVRQTLKWRGDTLRPGDRISADEIGRAGGQSKIDSLRRLGFIAESEKRTTKRRKPRAEQAEETPVVEPQAEPEGETDGS